jgi:uncharacterized protein YutE (UPF0331/DUF86 family)
MNDSRHEYALLNQEIQLMHRAGVVLEKSFNECQQAKEKKGYPLEGMDQLELLSSRFSRLTDFMVQRIFRLIDKLDLEIEGTIRDAINRAEKKGLIAEAETFIQARILRNRIAHEYVDEVMTEIFEEAVRLVPMVLDSVKRVSEYVQRYENPRD